jgi:hypothetical protein
MRLVQQHIVGPFALAPNSKLTADDDAAGGEAKLALDLGSLSQPAATIAGVIY